MPAPVKVTSYHDNRAYVVQEGERIGLLVRIPDPAPSLRSTYQMFTVGLDEATQIEDEDGRINFKTRLQAVDALMRRLHRAYSYKH